jgi:CHAT domain-containing protein
MFLPLQKFRRLATAAAFSFISIAACRADEAHDLQSDAIQRIDNFIDNFRRTGDTQTLLPDLQRAQRELARSAQLFTASGDTASASLSLCKIADAERMQSRWQQAKQLYDQSYALVKKVNAAGYQAQILLGRARTENTGLHDYAAALTDVQEAIRLSVASGDRKTLCRSLSTLADTQQNRGELTAAADTANRELRTALELKQTAEIVIAHMDLASVLAELASKCTSTLNFFKSCDSALQASEENYQKGIALASTAGYRGLEAMIRQQLDRLQWLQGANQRREAMQRRVDNTLNPATPRDVLVTENFSPGAVADPQAVARLAQAQAEAVRQAEAAGRPLGPVDVYTKGLIASIQGHDDQALTFYLQAVQLLEQDREKLDDEASRGTYLTDKMDIYYAPLMELLRRHKYAEAFDLLERSRSRAFADSLSSKKLQFSNAREQNLYAQWMAINANTAKRQAELYALVGVQTADSEVTQRIAAAEHEISELTEQRRVLLAQMARTAPNLQSLTVSQPVSLSQLQDSMRQEGYEALYYLTLDPSTVIWHISADSVEVRKVFLPRFEMAKKVATLRQSLADPGAKFDRQIARQMFLFLLQPMLPYIHSKRLIIFPQEELYYVPFQVFEDPAEQVYAGERFDFSYAPSATVLLKLKHQPNIAGGKLLAVADPDLPAAAHEIDAISRLYPHTSRIFKDPLLTKIEFKADVAGNDVVHVAVHGKFEATEPLLSYLALREGPHDDGRLTAAEMFGLPLQRTRLVVLSACETGRIQATHANEIQGIARGLLYAGANNLLLSSWKVDSDSTAVWMQTFYREAQTHPVADAARRALIAVKSMNGYSHPYYWAPFIVIGK